MRFDPANLRRFWLVPLVLLVLIAACGDDDNPTAPTDTTAPAAIGTLATGTITAHTVVLTWTAVGDDSLTGTASQYDIRYSTATITAGNFGSATAVSGEPTPTAAGTAQQMTVTGLTAATPYYFAMKTPTSSPAPPRKRGMKSRRAPSLTWTGRR
jgi:phosphodiesterase/alkaline phosphatase D-like protein